VEATALEEAGDAAAHRGLRRSPAQHMCRGACEVVAPRERGSSFARHCAACLVAAARRRMAAATADPAEWCGAGGNPGPGESGTE
jgi:hypothetical protein